MRSVSRSSLAAALLLAGCGTAHSATRPDHPQRPEAPEYPELGGWTLLQSGPVVPAEPDAEPLQVNNAAFSDERRGIAICYPAHVLLTEDGGKTWRRSSLPLTNGGLNTIEVNGSSAWTSAGGGMRVSSDGGASWRELGYYGSIYSAGNQFSFASPRIGWYAMSHRGTLPSLSLTRDGGETWKPVSLPAEADERIMAVSLVSEKMGFVLLLDGTIRRTLDGGKTWTTLLVPQGGRQLPVQNPRAQVEAIRFEDASRGTVVLYFEKPRGFAIFDTVDGGRSWRETGLPAAQRPVVGNVFLSRDRRFLTVADLDTMSVKLYRRD